MIQKRKNEIRVKHRHPQPINRNVFGLGCEIEE